MMTTLVLSVSFILLALAIVLALIRLARGPGILDRILAFDLIATCVVGLIILLSKLEQATHYVDVILMVSLLGFFTTVAFVFYLHQHMPTRAPSENPPEPGQPEDFE